MDIKSIIRTSAIIYADETNFVKTSTIQRKFIEAIFIDNKNKPLILNNLISAIEKKFNLSFTLEETIDIINKSENEIFSTKQLGSNSENNLISLSEKRFQYLIQKDQNNDFEKFVAEFAKTCCDNKVKSETINSTLYKFLFELLNTNISLYSNIVKPKGSRVSFTIDSEKFTTEEINIVNDFLNWDSVEKNKALFKVVSYCIEYSLVANHTSGDNTYLASLRNKEFYLDNNILYRALGVNGETRKKRTHVFLRKCIESGQKLIISKYSKKEFISTIEYHINQLKKIPFGRINPKLFSQYCVNPSFYEFYHKWRNSRITYGFDSFYANILAEYDLLIKTYKILEDYKIPFDEKDKDIVNATDTYKSEIQAVKTFGFEDTHKYDAQNYILIEKKRNENNRNIQDTKYFLITTDQKLKRWDDEKSKNQSITMLPSHWMGLLLKYVSRTDDDYKSFVSFLRLKQHDGLIDENNLQIVLAGISEITEDFKRQETVMEQMVANKFSGIIDYKNSSKTKEEAKKFAKEVIEAELENQILTSQDNLNQLKDSHEIEKSEIHEGYKQQIDILFKNYQKDRLSDKLESVKREIKKIMQLQKNALQNAEKKYLSKKYKFSILPIVFFITLIVCVIKFTWNIMEPITWLSTFIIIGLSYAYMIIYGKSFNPNKYFEELKERCVNEAYNDFLVDLSELEELETLKLEIEQKINAT